ncbi:MAG: hypothetical protein ACI3W5_12100 [Faecousia sp.]
MDYSALIEALRWKREITPLEKDILDTANELQKMPFDRSSAEKQVISNNANHPEIFAKIAALPTTVTRPWNEATDSDIRYNLTHQLGMLAEKEWEVQQRGQ